METLQKEVKVMGTNARIITEESTDAIYLDKKSIQDLIEQNFSSLFKKEFSKYSESRDNIVPIEQTTQNQILNELKKQNDHIQFSMDSMNKRFEAMDRRFEAVDKHFEAMDKRFEDMREYSDKRFEAMDKRFEAMDNRFEDMKKYSDKRFEAMDKRFEAIDKRFEVMDRRFTELTENIKEQFKESIQYTDKRFTELLANANTRFADMKFYFKFQTTMVLISMLFFSALSTTLILLIN